MEKVQARTEAKVTRLKTAVAVMAVALLIAACGEVVAENGGVHMDAPETTVTTETPEAPSEDHGDEHGEEAEDEHGDMDMSEARVIELSMTEFAFSPAPVSVEVGEMVTFIVTNDGVVEHEFEVTTAAGRAEHEHAEGHGEASTDKLVLDPGETGELTVMFDGEVDEIACLIPGHYDAGMLLQVIYEN